MGNTTSSSTDESNLTMEIDRIASKYILSQNFKDMNKLSEKDHCDKLVILTAKIIDKNLTALEQKNMVKRIDNKGKDNNGKNLDREADKGKEQGKDKDREADKGKDNNGKNLDKEREADKGKDKGADKKKDEDEDEDEDDDDEKKEKKEEKEKKAKEKKDKEDEEEDNDNSSSERKEDKKKKKKKEGGAQNEVPSAAAQKEVPSANEVVSAAAQNAASAAAEVPSAEETKTDCIEIAKFYVKIAHVYAAIMRTINPVIISTDKNGKRQTYDLMSKSEIPTEAEIESIEHNNFCTRRMNNLIQESDYDNRDPKHILLSIKPRFCNLNYDKDTKKTLKFYDDKKPADENNTTEIGIPELMKLYYDVYDEKKSEFASMSPQTKQIYERDVASFYKTFTGKDVPMDENGEMTIKRFDQIPLREFHKNDKCKPDGMYTQNFEGDLNDKLFQRYALHITKMMNNMNINQDKLLKILKQLFVFTGPKAEPRKINEKKYKTPPTENETNKTTKPPTTQGNIVVQNMQGPAAAAPAAPTKAAPAGMTGPAAAAGMTGPVAAAAQVTGPATTKEQDNDTTTEKNKVQVPGQEPDIEVGGGKNDDEDDEDNEGNEDNDDRKNAERKKDKDTIDTNIKDTNTEEDTVAINPKLDGSLLQSLINSTRKLIVELYITCETDFLEGIQLFESIVAVQLAKTTNSQIKLLNDLTSDYLAEHVFEKE